MATSTVLGTCHHDCPDSCGWVATVEHGRLISLKGNPDHPFAQGQLCPKVNRFVHRVNDTERLLTPLIRTGSKGSGEFRSATWDEALDRIVARVGERIDRHGGTTVLPWWSAGTQGTSQHSSLSLPLFDALGASQQVGNVCGEVAAAGMAAAYGSSLGGDPLEVEHAQLILLWGTNTRLTNRHLWPVIERARSNGAQVVVIDPMRTLTADSADRFIQVLPGTDVALLLAMMHVLVEDDLLDHAYLRDHSVGFEIFRETLRDRSPEWAAERCGVSAEEIRWLATEYGAAQPAFIRALIGAEHHEHGAMTFRLLSLLPVMTGSWRHRGGGLARSVGAWAEAHGIDLGAFAPEESTQRRSFLQSQLSRTLTDDSLDPPVTALFVWNGNPVLSMPNAATLRRGLGREDLFTVVSEQFMTDTAIWADVVLPAAMQTETLDVVASWGHNWLGWNQPATEPQGEAVANTELFRRLSAAFGFTDEIFQRSDDDLIELVLRPEVDRVALERDGFVRVPNTDDPLPYADGGFATPSGRAEFVSERVVALGHPAVPGWSESAEGPTARSAFPLMLTTPKNQIRFLNTSYSGLEGHAGKEKGPFIELDETDASERGLSEGDLARAFNDRGEVRLPVRISERLRPGLAAIPWGFVIEAHDAGAANDLTNEETTDLGGGASYGDTRIQVEAVES